MARDFGISDDPVQPLRWLGELVLLERLGEHSWMVRATAAGTEAVARPLAARGRAGLDPAALVRTTASLIGSHESTLLPVLGVGTHRGRPWLASEFDAGVDLCRFMDVIRPSPGQALLLAGDILSAVWQLHASGRVHTRLHAGNVQVSPDGTARLGDWAVADPAPPDRWDELRRSDVARAADLVTSLATAARCPAGSGSEAARLLTRLPRRLRGPTSWNSPYQILDQMQGALGDEVTRDELRAETAELVAAAGAAGRAWHRPAAPAPAPSLGRPPDDDAAVALIRQPPPAPHIASSPSPRLHQGPRSLDRTAKTLWSLALAVAVLGLVVGAEITFLHRPIVRDLQALRQPAPSRSSATSTPPPAPTGSLPAGGPLRSVDVRSLQTCTPGRSCLVRVVIDVKPQPRPTEVAWTFKIYDRCAPSAVSAAGGRQSLTPGGSQVVGLATVVVPSWPAVQLVVRTTAPAAATSTPLLVPATGANCTRPSPGRP